MVGLEQAEEGPGRLGARGELGGSRADRRAGDLVLQHRVREREPGVDPAAWWLVAAGGGEVVDRLACSS